MKGNGISPTGEITWAKLYWFAGAIIAFNCFLSFAFIRYNDFQNAARREAIIGQFNERFQRRQQFYEDRFESIDNRLNAWVESGALDLENAARQPN